jgi:uncharacterized protein YndB with AHSA1/START domain
MERLSYEIEIVSPRERVWEVLWTRETYRRWTSPFAPGSDVETDWKEGSEIRFLNGEGRGMYAIIERADRPAAMVFRHLGELDGEDRKPFDRSSGWNDTTESYFLEDAGGSTRLRVEMASDPQWTAFFDVTFPKALAIVKEISES